MKTTTTFRDSVVKCYKRLRALGYHASTALHIAKHEARYGHNEDFCTRTETCIQRRKHELLPSYGEERYDLSNGMYAVVEVERDNVYDEPPWEDCDGHGVVSDWESIDREDHRWMLCCDRSSARYYDQKAALKIAKRDGWGPCAPEEAVKHNFEYLEAWCNDQWCYVCLTVTLFDKDGEEFEEESVGGYESFAEDYMCSEARSWLAGMLRRYRCSVRAIARARKIESRFRDAMECGI
jgi:hypothetical protein